MNRTLLLLILLLPLFAKAQRITVTVAGTGLAGFNGDGNPSISTLINRPFDVCVDAAHNIYFTDNSNGRVRKLSAKNGMITTVAGGGTTSADGIPATSELLSPVTLCIDAAGNLYLTSAGVVKRVDAATNIITTLPLFSEGGICIDNAGNLYGLGHDVVNKLAAGSGIVTTIAGTGAGGYTGDGGPATAATMSFSAFGEGTFICVNAGGDVYFLDQGTSVIRKIEAATGIISTIAGDTTGPLFGVPAMSARLGMVTGLCIDGSGNLFFNELSCSCRKIDMTTDSVYIVGGNYGVESFRDDTNSVYSWMHDPYGLCADAGGNIYIADEGNNRIRKLIQLTPVPTFALGEGQTIEPCSGTACSINTQMSITDIDFGQPETWTVLNAPVNGTLTGFPYTKPSLGTDSLVLPTGLSYMPGAGYTGADSFRIRVTDGIYADTVMVYVSVSAPPSAGVISSPSGPEMCIATSAPFSETIAGGTWSMTNSNAYILSADVTAITPGLDTIIYTPISYRCPVTSSYTISIMAWPAPGIISGTDSICAGSSVTLTDTAAGVWSVTNSNASVSSSGLVSGLLPGSDIVNYAVTNVCGTVTASLAIRIDSIPYAGMLSGAGNVCEGSTITLTDSITTGLWTASNRNAAVSGWGIINGISTGVDTILYTVSNACGAAIASAIVTIDPLPHAGLILGDSTVCLGATISLTDTVPDGIWTQINNHGMLSSSGSYYGLSVGVDTVFYSVVNSCGGTSATLQIKVIDCTGLGINAGHASSDLNLFPNPVSSVLNIAWTNWLPQNTVVVEDISGRVISRTAWANTDNGIGSMEIDATNLTPGVYFVKINSSEVRRFVKE